MADPAETPVDQAIAKMQSVLDELKGAQKRDDESEGPKTLPEANAEARRRFTQARDSAKNNPK